MKYVLSLLLVVVVVQAAFARKMRPGSCGVPSCRVCETTTPKPSCEEPMEHRCDVPKCKKCVVTTPKPDCEEPYVEEEECPEGSSWNGYFCAPDCSCTTHKPACHYRK